MFRLVREHSVKVLLVLRYEGQEEGEEKGRRRGGEEEEEKGWAGGREQVNTFGLSHLAK